MSVLADEPALEPFAAALRARLDPLSTSPGRRAVPPATLCLAVTRDGLELRDLLAPRDRPLTIDWPADPSLMRRRGARQLLARAIGWPGSTAGSGWLIVDATAGLGRDAFLLAMLGAQVVAVERSPVVAALLRDARRRALLDPEAGPMVGARLSFVEGDARDWLSRLPAPDVVYLDPMYSASERSALSAKPLRVLGRLVGHDDDAGAVLAIACSLALRRVVVKRHLRAPPLSSSPPPDLVWRGASVRYDVWLRR
ncbi:MAG: class I SAM-dependent methyltransferase [Planctomycetota bacterium]